MFAFVNSSTNADKCEEKMSPLPHCILSREKPLIVICWLFHQTSVCVFVWMYVTLWFVIYYKLHKCVGFSFNQHLGADETLTYANQGKYSRDGHYHWKTNQKDTLQKNYQRHSCDLCLP